MMTTFKLVGLMCVLFVFSIPAQAILIGPLELKTQVQDADLVVVGRVAEIKKAGKTAVKWQTEMVPAWKMVARFEIHHIVKGKVRGPSLSFEFPIPFDFLGQMDIQPDLFGMFFLKYINASDPNKGFQVLTIQHPFTVGSRNDTRLKGSEISDFEQALHEMVKVITLSSTTIQECDVAMNVLSTAHDRDRDKNIDVLLEKALHQAAQTREYPVNLWAMTQILSNEDLTFLETAVQLILNSPPTQPPTTNIYEVVFFNRRSGLGFPVLKNPKAFSSLVLLVNSPYEDVRQSVVESIGEIGGIQAIGPLLLALNDEDSFVRYEAVCGLAKVAGQPKSGEWSPEFAVYQQNEALYLAHWREWATQQLAMINTSKVEPEVSSLDTQHSAY